MADHAAWPLRALGWWRRRERVCRLAGVAAPLENLVRAIAGSLLVRQRAMRCPHTRCTRRSKLAIILLACTPTAAPTAAVLHPI